MRYLAMDDPVDRGLYAMIYDNAYTRILTEKNRRQITEKIQDLTNKHDIRLKQVLSEKLNIENCESDDIEVMQDYLQTADFRTMQLNNAIGVLERFLPANAFYKGRKTNRELSEILSGKFYNQYKCKCRHSINDHSGDFGEKSCCMGCDCKKYDGEKHEKELAKISSKPFQKTFQFVTNTNIGDDVPDEAISCCDGEDPNCCGAVMEEDKEPEPTGMEKFF